MDNSRVRQIFVLVNCRPRIESIFQETIHRSKTSGHMIGLLVINGAAVYSLALTATGFTIRS